MFYTDANRRRATQVGQDSWTDMGTLFGPKYDYGTEHELRFDELDEEPSRYVVAMLPHIKQVTHPTQSERTILLHIVYLTSSALWPFFELITVDSIHKKMLPEG